MCGTRSSNGARDGIAPVPASRVAGFAFLLTLVVTGLALVATHRTGRWRQVPSWDEAWFHNMAIRTRRAVATDGLWGLARSWARESGAHAPLVPAASAGLMAIFGESREAAEAVLPLFLVLFFAAVFRIAERLHGAATAFGATALLAAFPVTANLARSYLLDGPMAALFAAACLCLLRGGGFARTGPALAFGILAGLTSVARTGAAVFLTGPVLVAIAAIRWLPAGARRAAVVRGAIAVLIAGLIAASYHVPNARSILAYFRSVTYGAKAAEYAAGGSFSLENATHLLHRTVLDGPGLPLAAVALLATCAVLAFRGPRVVFSRRAAVPAAAAAATFIVALAGAQRTGGRFLYPLLPLLAMWIARSVTLLPWRAARRGAGLLATILALHPAVVLTFPPRTEGPIVDGRGVVPGVALWNHRDWFLGLAAATGMERPDQDLGVPGTVDRIAALPGPDDRHVFVASDHPFFQINALRLEAERRGLRFTFGNAPSLREAAGSDWLRRFREDFLGAHVVVARTGGGNYRTDLDYAPAVADAVAAAGGLFVAAGSPVVLEDGSAVRLWRRRPGIERVSSRPAEHVPVDAAFTGRTGRVRLQGVSFHRGAGGAAVSLCFATGDAGGLPPVFVHLLDGVVIVRSVILPALGPEEAPAGSVMAVRAEFDGPAFERPAAMGLRVACGLLDGATERFSVRAPALPVDDGATRVHVLDLRRDAADPAAWRVPFTPPR